MIKIGSDNRIIVNTMADTSINTNESLKCPFRATIITRSFSCECASEITRRDGPDIGCSCAETHEFCDTIFARLKDVSLPALGYEDDLTSMPASALQKIQFGGLLALFVLVNEQEPGDAIENIAELVRSGIEKYTTSDNVPVDACVDKIQNYKIKRRRRS